MHTKGVASVRSPVCNLVGSNPGLTHEAFVEAVIRSFREEYGVDDEVRVHCLLLYQLCLSRLFLSSLA